MAQKSKHIYLKPTKVRRRRKPRPLNHQKTLGPKSGWMNAKKKKRGQGAS